MKKLMKSVHLILAFVFLSLSLSSLPARAAESERTFDRVMASNTIKCGYIVYPPQLSKDPNTGKLSGLAYDLMERMGHDLNLKVEWTEEVGGGTWIEGIKTDRYDVLCNTAWATTVRAPHVLASIPAFFTAVNAYARKDDHRFDKKISLANSPDVKIATIDGATSAAIAADTFPLAQRVSLPELTDFSQLLLEVSTGKADITFSEAAQFNDFDDKNPNLLRNVTVKEPVRLVQNTFFVAGDEQRLISMLNLALQNLHNSGFVDQLLDKYESRSGTWFRVTKSYETRK